MYFTLASRCLTDYVLFEINYHLLMTEKLEYSTLVDFNRRAEGGSFSGIRINIAKIVFFKTIFIESIFNHFGIKGYIFENMCAIHT